MSRLRVLIVSGYFPLIPGGAEYQAYLLACELKKYHEVNYVFRYGTERQRREMHGCTLHLLPKRWWRQRVLGKDYVFDYLAVMAALEEIGPDIIYNRGANAYTGIAARYARKNGCRMVWHIASDRDVEPHWGDSVRGRILHRVDTKCVEYGIRNAGAIIGQTVHQDGLLQKNYGRRCDLIVGNAHPEPSETILKDEPVTVVWVGNLKPLKQPEAFIHLARMLHHRREVRFVMIGRPASGRYQRKLDRAMEGLPNLAYAGERSIDEVNRTLARAHVFVNTSLYEGFPNTFVQAWFRRVPVVSLNVDPDDVLKKEGLGLHSQSLEGLARDTERLISDRDLRESMGRTAYAYALRRHSAEANINKIISFFANGH